jgi:transcriptional regulator with XRE-family HTH domain
MPPSPSTEDVNTPPSNEEVGRALAVSHASVSRYKSGDRYPELDTLARIAQIYGWSIDDQYKAKLAGTYADEFTRRVADRAPLGAVVENAPPHQQSDSR